MRPEPGVAALGPLAALLLFCGPAPAGDPGAPPSPAVTEEERERPAPEPDPHREKRLTMVARTIEPRGVRDAAVLRAMRTVPRHRFVPAAMEALAYSDQPLPIGLRQTISQPYIVALMTELAGIEPGERVLEIGTGSGYQAAVLAEVAAEVYSIEILEELSRNATALLEELGYDNVDTRVGDGYRGWPEKAPFDAILVTAAPPEVPQPLVEQLAMGGRMVIPVGRGYQELIVLERTADGIERRRSIPVRFVPMTGEAQE